MILATGVFFISGVAVAGADYEAEYKLQSGYWAYESGSYELAITTWTPLAESGNAWAQHNLGRLYHTGKGVDRDLTAAATWYYMAAKQDLAVAQLRLAMMYYAGAGVIGNAETALKWFTKAAEQGNGEAMSWLGLLYMNGWGTPSNYKTSLKWYIKAASQGIAHAQNTLAIKYEQGIYVPKDYTMSYMWSNLYAYNGLSNNNLGMLGSEHLAGLSRRMTEEQIATAKEMTKRCLASFYKNCEPL